MFDAKSVRRALLLTTVLAVSAAPAASAREADAPVHQSSVAVATTSVPPRVDGIGQPPATDRGGRVAVATPSVPPRVDGIGQPPGAAGRRVATPLVQASSDDGFDWTLAGLGAAGLLTLVLLGAAGWKTRSRRMAHS
jgi:hypothetical protein